MRTLVVMVGAVAVVAGCSSGGGPGTVAPVIPPEVSMVAAEPTPEPTGGQARATVTVTPTTWETVTPTVTARATVTAVVPATATTRATVTTTATSATTSTATRTVSSTTTQTRTDQVQVQRVVEVVECRDQAGKLIACPAPSRR